MLRSLIYRDWMLNRMHLLLMLGIVGLFQVYFVLRMDSTRLWLVFTGFYMAFQTIVPYTREEKFGSAGWTLTLPVSRSQIVRARWIGSWLYVLAGVALALAMGLLLPGSRIRLLELLVPDTLLLAAAVVTLILALLLPFTIRYGLMGVMIFLVATQLLGAGALVAAVAFGGRGRAIGRTIHATIEGTRAGLLSLQATLSPAVFYVAVAVALLLLNWLGYRFALVLYRRREF